MKAIFLEDKDHETLVSLITDEIEDSLDEDRLRDLMKLYYELTGSIYEGE